LEVPGYLARAHPRRQDARSDRRRHDAILIFLIEFYAHYSLSLLIGVANTEARCAEYTYTEDHSNPEIAGGPGGRGEEYLDFLEAKVPPFPRIQLCTRSQSIA